MSAQPSGVGGEGGARLSLLVVAGPAQGEQIDATTDPIVLGRAQSGAGSLGGDFELSREHARISLFEGGLLLEDLGSTNGTFVNGGRVAAPTVLRDGDFVWLGNTTMVVRAVGEGLPRVTPVEPPTPSAQGGFLSRVADAAEHHPKRVLVAVGIFLAAAIALGGPVAKQLRDERGFFDPDAQSSQALDHLATASGASPGAGAVVLVRGQRDVSADPALKRKVRRLQRKIEANPAVAGTVSYFDFGDGFFISRDGTSTYIGVIFKNASLDDREKAAAQLRSKLSDPPSVTFGGPLLANRELRSTVEKDLRRAEIIGLPLLLIASFFVFRSLVAAFLPIFVGLITIFASFLALRVIDTLSTVNVFALNMVTALGLGLAIDYSLFMVSRYREELAKVGAGRPRGDLYGATSTPPPGAGGLRYAGSQAEAMRRTVMTAGRTIMFSSVTVAIAMVSLVVFKPPFLYSMGIGGATAALISMVVSLVTLPAVLSLLGPRINSLAPKAFQRAAYRSATQERAGFWYRLTQVVMRRPLPIALLSAALMIAVALSLTRIDFIGVNARVLPAKLEAKEVSNELSANFPADPSGQIEIAAEAEPRQAAAVRRYALSLEKLQGVAAVLPPRSLNAQFWEIDVQPWNDGLDDQTVHLVREIRARGAPFPIEVAGDAADFIDQKASLSSRLPLAFVILGLVTFVVLFVMTGSVVLPVKTVIMNLLTVGFTLGVLVLIFQDGRLESVLRFVSSGKIDLAQPLVICAVVFGLSTDYAVFLLGRISEARSQGVPDREAVAVGLERTGRIVTQAAILFVLAIGAFSTSSVVFIKEVGVGAAVAVIIDSTIVRALLVPSLMALLGARNWWSPGPLRRLHSRIGLSEA